MTSFDLLKAIETAFEQVRVSKDEDQKLARKHLESLRALQIERAKQPDSINNKA